MLASFMSEARKPPPLPNKPRPVAIGSDRPPLPPPTATHKPPERGEQPSQALKDSITEMALGLLEEQVQARIVHYKGEMETSPELDAITAQVVAQLKAMQQAAAQETTTRISPDEAEDKQTRALTALLGRTFEPQSQFPTRILKPIGKKIAKLFFESELHEKSKGDKEKTIFHAEQGVYYVLQRYKNRLRAELEGFEFVNDEIRGLTLDLLAKIERDLQVGFLSRRSPELNRVMTVYTHVLADFLTKYLPPRLEQMSKVTIRDGKYFVKKSASTCV